MTATSQYPAADQSNTSDTTRVPEVRPRPIKPRGELLPAPEPSLARRAFRALFRFLIAVGVGIGGTLAWQAHGDEARQMIATAYPERLGWIAPPAPATAPAPQSARAADSAPALASAAPSVDEEHLKAMAADLAAMRQSIEQLAGQVASGQQQVSDEISKLGDEIAKLRTSEQDILNRIPPPPPQRPAAAPARRPAPPPPTFAAPPPAPQVR